MHKIYKSGTIELSDEAVTVVDDSASLVSDTDGGEIKDGEILNSRTEDRLDTERKAAKAIIEKANQHAAEIIKNAQSSIAEQREQARQEATREAADIRAKAYNEGWADGQSKGYADGAAAKVSSIEQVLNELETMVTNIEGSVSGFITQYENDLRWAVAQVSSKVLGRLVDEDELELVELVKDAVEQVRNAEWINVHLCSDSVMLIERLERELAPLQHLEIVPDNLPPGSCIVDTPTIKLDASIQAQMENLKDYLSDYL